MLLLCMQTVLCFYYIVNRIAGVSKSVLRSDSRAKIWSRGRGGVLAEISRLAGQFSDFAAGQ